MKKQVNNNIKMKKVLLATAIMGSVMGITFLNVNTSYAAESYITGSLNNSKDWQDSTENSGWQYDVVDNDNTKCIIRPSSDATKTGDVAIPSTIDGKTVVAVMTEAFKDCTGLTSVTLPDTCTELGASAFEGCTGLRSITGTENINILGHIAFYNCSSLNGKITFGNVDYLDYNMFYGCSNIEELEFGNINSIMNSNSWADFGTAYHNWTPFNGCTKLKRIKMGNVNKAGSAKFNSDNGKESSNDTTFWGLGNLETLELGSYPGSIPVDRGCDKLKNITVDSVDTLKGAYAYGDVFNYAKWYSAFPNSLEYFKCGKVKSVESAAFAELNNLHYVEFDSNGSLPDYIFKNCSALKSTETNIKVNNITSVGVGAFTGSGITEIKTGDLTALGDRAFSNCKSLKNVEIGNITKFGSKVFTGCTALETLKLGDFDSIYSYNAAASLGAGIVLTTSEFENLSNLRTIELGNVKEIGSNAFQKVGDSLTTVKVGNVDTIGDEAFAYNKNLESFVAGDIKSLSTSAFKETKIGQTVSVTLKSGTTTVTKLVAKGMKASNLDKVDIDGKVFCGWYTDGNCQHPFVDSITENMTLYAGYADRVYYVNQDGEEITADSNINTNSSLTVVIDGKPAGDVTYSWSWLKPGSSIVGYVAPIPPIAYGIPGANKQTYVVEEAYKGRPVWANVYMNGYNLPISKVNVAGEADDANGPKIDINSVTINGTDMNVGGILTATTDPEGATGTYQWKISDTENGEYTNIEGATDKTYEITVNDKDKYIKCEFTGTDFYRDQIIDSNTLLVYGAAKDIDTTLNVTLGSTDMSNAYPSVGSTFTASTSEANEGHVTYQWYRSNSNRYTSDSFTPIEGDELIEGATDKTYTVTKSDLGKYVYVVMTGKSDRGYNGCVERCAGNTVNVSSTNNIGLWNDTNNNYASDYDVFIGNTISVQLPSEIKIEDVNIKWFRTTSRVYSTTSSSSDYNTFSEKYSSAEQITGENGNIYKLSKKDFGKYVFAVVEDKAGSTVAYKAITSSTSYCVNASVVNDTGLYNDTQDNYASDYAVFVGNTLSVKLPEGITADDVNIRWFRGTSKIYSSHINNSSSDYNDFDKAKIPAGAEQITGASSATYELQKADFGKYVFAVISDKKESEKVYKAITSSTSYCVNASVVNDTGLYNDTQDNYASDYAVFVGNTLSVKLPEGITADDVNIRWFRGTSKIYSSHINNSSSDYNDFDKAKIPAGAEQITGASSDKYTVTLDEAGKYVFAVISDKKVSKKVYKAITSSTSYKVEARVTTFNIEGVPYTNKELSVNTNFGAIKFNSYQWYRSGSQGSTGTEISGATKSTYTPTQADVGYYINCYVSSPESPYTGSGWAYGTTAINKLTDCTAIGDKHVSSEWIVTKKATCEQPGTKIKTCKVCGSLLETAEIDPIGHHFEKVDGKYICTNEINLVSEPVNDTSYPWTFNNNMWKSNIAGVTSGSTSLTFNFTLTKSTPFSFDWYSNGEGSYDTVKCKISKDGSELETLRYGDSDRSTSITEADLVADLQSSTPNYFRHVNKTLEAGTYTVTFNYYKDGGGDVGLDSAFIANVSATSQCGAEKTIQKITKAGLTGTAKVGKTLTLNTVPADATGTIEWWTSDDGDAWMNILDANGRTYTLTEDEEGKYIKATITGTGDYTGTAEAVTPFKVSGVYSTISNPSMSMTENVGETMRFTYEPADATLEFRWQRSQDGNTWTDIEGETSNEYTVKSEDQGYKIRMTVQGTGDYRNFKYTSPIANIKEDVTSIDLEVTGTKQVGKVLRAKVTPEDVEVKYSWLIGDSKDGDFTEVSSSSSYKLTESDGGKFIKLKVTGVSDPTLVAESEPAKVRKIVKSLVITGIPKVGKTLTAVINPSEATGDFQWEISDENGVFNPIDGADSKDYIIKKSDAGHWIKVTWTGTGDWEGMKVTLTSGGGRTNSSTTIPGKNGTIATEEWKDEDVKVDWTTKVEGGTVSDSTTTLPDNSTTTKGDKPSSGSGDISTAKPGDVITFPKPDVPAGATNGHYEWKYKDDDPNSPTFGEWVLIDGEYGDDLTISETLKNKVIRRDYIFEDEDGNTMTISNAVFIQDEDEADTKTDPGERIPTSKEKVDYTAIGTDEVYNGYKQGVKVYVSQGQDIAVQLPFKAVLDGQKGVRNKADFKVQVRANIAGDDNVKVIPESAFTMTTPGKNDINGTVTVDQTEFNIKKDTEEALATGKIINGTVEAFNVSAGHWEGGFSWTISVEGMKIDNSTESTDNTVVTPGN